MHPKIAVRIQVGKFRLTHLQKGSERTLRVNALCRECAEKSCGSEIDFCYTPVGMRSTETTGDAAGFWTGWMRVLSMIAPNGFF